MTFDLTKKYSVEEYDALINSLDFPFDIDSESVVGFELLRNGLLSPMGSTPPYKETAVSRLDHLMNLYSDSGLCPGSVTCSQGGFKMEDYHSP